MKVRARGVALERWRSSVVPMLAQPVRARSLDLDLHHLGALVRVECTTPCAVCSTPIPAGANAIRSTCTDALAHTSCGEVINGAKPGATKGTRA